MYTVKTGQPLLQLVELCYYADKPLLLCGSHGIGKSELLGQAADEMNIEFICRDLSLLEPTDLTGLPKSQDQCTVYLQPAFLPRKSRGLLVFEELNRCERYMRAPCLELLTTRRLNDYRLPEGWLPVAAINPAGEDYEVAELDPALASRFVQAQLVPDRQEWLKWAESSDVHPAVINYVYNDPTIFDHADSNPRAWKYVSDLLVAAKQQQTPTSILRAAVFGTVGDKRGAAFLRSLAGAEQPLPANEILTRYGKHRSDVRRWIKNGHLDLVETSLQGLLIALQPQADYNDIRSNKACWKRLGHFLSDLPGDLQQQARDFFSERKYEFPQSAFSRKGEGGRR